MTWFYKDGDQEIGPVSKAQLQDLIKSKQITGETLIRSVTTNQWRPISEMVRPRSEGSVSQPPPPEPPLKYDSPTVPMPSVVILDAEVPFQFRGRGGEYFKIWIVNVLLSIVTFGIYSAWAKVRRKQYFYGNSSVSGAAFRYLANPVKILKGRLVVFLGFVVYSLINQFVPLAGVALTLVLIFIMPWLIVRSLAFNARNSAWRNIRFNFMGTYGGAALEFIVWPLLVVPTLGILFPYVFYRQKKFIVEHLAFGTTPFTFRATSKEYYAIVAKFLIPVILAAAVIGAAAFLLQPYLASLAPLAPIFAFLTVCFYLYAVAYFSVKFSNLLYNSSSLVRHRFKSSMAVRQYGRIMVTNTLATVLTLGLFHPFAQVRALRYKIENLAVLPGGDLNQFVAAEAKETSALGDELSDFMDFDFGI